MIKKTNVYRLVEKKNAKFSEDHKIVEMILKRIFLKKNPYVDKIFSSNYKLIFSKITLF